MAVLSGATASGRQFCNIQPTVTSATLLYTAPSASSNVTSPSATSYIKEIIICNTSSGAVNISIWIGPSNSAANSIVNNLSVAGYDTKVLSGLNTMLSPGNTVYISPSVASTINVIMSGVEIQ